MHRITLCATLIMAANLSRVCAVGWEYAQLLSIDQTLSTCSESQQTDSTTLIWTEASSQIRYSNYDPLKLATVPSINAFNRQVLGRPISGMDYHDSPAIQSLLGAKGWEMVSYSEICQPLKPLGGQFGTVRATFTRTFWYKRPQTAP